MVWALADPRLNQYAGSAGAVGQPWPHVAQVCRVERQRVVRTTGGGSAKAEREVWYYLTSQSADQADAQDDQGENEDQADQQDQSASEDDQGDQQDQTDTQSTDQGDQNDQGDQGGDGGSSD